MGAMVASRKDEISGLVQSGKTDDAVSGLFAGALNVECFARELFLVWAKNFSSIQPRLSQSWLTPL
jgi:hypothetical protein